MNNGDMEPIGAIASPRLQSKLSLYQRYLLLITAAVSSSCGLAVELLLGTLASYLVGNQALSYGVAVGGFLAAMGLGAYLSRFVAPDDTHEEQPARLQQAFVWIELSLAPLCAIAPLSLFALFVSDGPFWIALFLATLLLGALSGMELPLLTRLLERDEGLKDALAGVLALDYIGALVGSLALPIVLLPWLGLFPSAVLIGAVQAGMVVAIGILFPSFKRWGRIGLALALALLILLPVVVPLGDRLENSLYKAPVISRIQSPYQRIILTRQGRDVRLFLDGNLQFSSLDEYRYHEALVHPALSANTKLRQEENASQLSSKTSSGSVKSKFRKVLLLGAGDGLALREVLKWSDVDRVVLIDLDQVVVNLAQHHPFLVKANANSFADPRVEVIQGDAFLLAPALAETFDVILADFPDPDRPVIAKLYAQGFYQRLLSRLAPNGIFVTQASSPFFAPRAFACVAATLRSLQLQTYPYTVDVPSFGPWGFVLATRSPLEFDQLPLPVTTRFLTQNLLSTLFELPKDLLLEDVEINRLAHPVIVKYQDDPRWSSYD